MIVEWRIDKGLPIPPKVVGVRSTLPLEERLARRRAYEREETKRRTRVLQAQGFCGTGGWCKEPKAEGHTICDFHLRYMRKKANERTAKYKAQGLCRQCGEPTFEGMAFCLLHRQGEGLPNIVKRRLRERREREEAEQTRKENLEKRRIIYENLHLLPKRHQEILKLRYPEDGSEGLTLQEIGIKYELTRERVRQLEEIAMLKIEKNVPLPNTNGKYKDEILETLKAMQPGDSFAVPTLSMKQLATHYAQAQGYMVVTRKDGDGFRVWMVSKGEESGESR